MHRSALCGAAIDSTARPKACQVVYALPLSVSPTELPNKKNPYSSGAQDGRLISRPAIASRSRYAAYSLHARHRAVVVVVVSTSQLVQLVMREEPGIDEYRDRELDRIRCAGQFARGAQCRKSPGQAVVAQFGTPLHVDR